MIDEAGKVGVLEVDPDRQCMAPATVGIRDDAAGEIRPARSILKQ
jgi:hypothetical protein